MLISIKLLTLARATECPSPKKMPYFVGGDGGDVVVNCLCKWPSGDYFLGGFNKDATPIGVGGVQSAFSLLYDPVDFEVKSGRLFGGSSVQMDEILACSDSTIIGTHLAAVLGPNNMVVTYDNTNTPLETFSVIRDVSGFLSYPDELQILYTNERIHFYALFTADKFVGSFQFGQVDPVFLFKVQSNPQVTFTAQTGLFIESDDYPNILFGAFTATFWGGDNGIFVGFDLGDPMTLTPGTYGRIF